MKSTRKMTNTIFAMLLGLLVIAASNQAFAQGGNWEMKAPMPTARYGTAGGVINDKLYVAGGKSGNNWETNFFATLEVYDPATDTWATKAPMPTPRVLAGAVAIDGKLYVVGGLGVQPQRWLTTLEVYDPATDTWATKAPMPTPRDWEGAVAIDGKLYVVGGCMGGCAPATGVLEVYDPATDIWTTKAPMPTARGAAGVEVVNGLLYVMGGGWGWDSSDSELKARTIEVYNPTTNIWTTRNQHVVGVGGTAGSINGKIYLAGFAWSVLTNTEVYDPATDTWASLSPMPTGRYIAAGGVINGKLYVAGGTDASWGPLATLEAFTPPSVPFAAFTAKVEIKLGPLANDDKFEVKATFALGAGSDGVDPLTEDVSLQVGTFSTTIPAGSFEFKSAMVNKKGKLVRPAQFVFEGVIDGVSLEAKITPLGGDTFEFKAEGEGADLTGTVNPVTVGLTIDDDGGSTTVTAEFE